MSFLTYQKENPDFLNNYLKYNRFISFRAETSVNEMYFDLRTFLRYIKMQKTNNFDIGVEDFKKINIKDITINDLNTVNQKTINDFIYFLRYTLDNNPKTRNRKLATLKKFFEYLAINNHINFNPAQNINSAKIEKRNPKYLNLTESKELLSKTINSNQRFKIRNYAITCIFLNCSIRVSELILINITDIKLDEGTLKIKGKGDKERIIYLNDATTEVIEKYLETRPVLPKTNPDYNALFISEQRKRISRRSVQNIIEQELYLLFEDKKKGYHTHTLRHTGATLMYNENDTDIMIIKKILGHASLSATEIYTHVSDKKMKNIMENCTISSILEKREELENVR